MSSLEKRHTSRRGSMQGHRKYSDGFSDTSSVGSFMDETDREVSNLTDRAFRSLCIGEEAIYNDSEISSPTERHKAFAKEVQQKEILETTCQDSFSHGIQYREAERRSEVTSTFQHSYVDVAQEQVLRDECMSYMSNGSMEATWQQKRSTSRVSSLIKAFSSKEDYCDSGTNDSILLRDKYRDFNNESWDKSAMISIQRELSNFSSACHQSFKSGPFQSYRNHFHASAAAITRMDTTASLVKSSETKFHALNSTNFFFHSEYSPFQLWKEYNRFPFEREKPSGLVSASEFPRWYDSPLYKELTAPHTFSNEGRRFNRRNIEDVVPTQRSRSTVIQKASAIEKRCESEIASNCPPWRMNSNFIRGKLPSNRPSTVSPTSEKMHRPDSSLLSHSRYTYEIQPKAEKVGANELPNSSTPFSITHLLTPVIHGRHNTETSEILQFAHTPTVPDHSVQGDIDLKPLTDVKQLRDTYKSKASSLLFNLKDNRKRVKSTYSPSKFKGLENPHQTKQPLKPENLESQILSDNMVTQEHSVVPNNWELGDIAPQTYEVCLSQTVEHKDYADSSHDNMTLVPQQGTSNYRISHSGSQDRSMLQDKFSNKENVDYEFLPHMLSAQKGFGNTETHSYGPGGKFNPTRPEIENILPMVHPSFLAQMSEKQTFSRREDMSYHDFKETQNFARKTTFEYTKNQVANEKKSRQNPGPINITNKEMLNNNGPKDSPPFKGEIAALIEMDRQRKAPLKQYLPSTNDSYTTGKESYINKVNENIKQGRLAKVEDVLDINGSLQKNAYISKLAQYHPADISSISQNLYGLRSAQNNGLHKKTSPPPKESNFNRNSEIRMTTHDKVEVGFQRDVKYATSDLTAARKDYSHEVQCSASLEEEHRNNEGSVAYQPYKYEPNKQWHLAATENRPTMNVKVPILRQLQTEKKSEQSMAPKQTYHTKQGDMMTEIKKLNIQSTELNNSLQAREDKFSINDILSIRDNEQAKRIKENKYSLTASFSHSINLERETSSVTSNIAKEKAAETEVFTLKEKQTRKDPTFYDKHENANMLHGYIGKESHDPNEGLRNIGTFMKDIPGKETVMDKENDKITPRTLSYKERGQTKQEILTSKLKAHAQKEISAIKEKGLAKQSILSRNLTKQSAPINNEKGQMSQEVVSPKKEITAEKLNHLFQDITYSSVTLFKEHRNQDKDGPKYAPLTAEEVKLPTRAIDPQVEELSEKNNDAVKDVKLTTNEKERTEVQPHTQRSQTQNERITVVGKKTCEIPCEYSKSSTENQKELSVDINVNHETTSSKSLSSHSAIQTSNEEPFVVKTEEQNTSGMPIVYTAGPTEYPMISEKKKHSPTYDNFGKTACRCTSHSDTEQAKLLDHKTEHPSVVKVDKLTANSATTHHKCTDLMEMTLLPVQNSINESQINAEREKPIKEPNEKKIGFEVKSPSDWTRLKNENILVLSAEKSTDTRLKLSTKHEANSVKVGEQLKSKDVIGSDNEILGSRDIKLPKTLEDTENLDQCGTLDMVQIDVEGNPGLKQMKEEDLHSQIAETNPVTQSKQEIRSTNYNSNPMVKFDAVTKCNNQQPQKDSDELSDLENQTQKEKDLFEQTDIASKKIQQPEDKSIVNIKVSEPTSTESKKSLEECLTLNVMIENKDEKMNSQTVQDKSPVPESHINHIPSEEHNIQADEPIIYSIRVSSKSDAVSEDEPVIYTICVSSISDSSMPDVPESQDKISFAPKQLSAGGTEKKEETSGSKNEETAEHCPEIKASVSKEAKGFFSTDQTGDETVDSATKDKQDYYRSSEVNNISSSYESLLAKYGLPNREKVHLKPEQKKQDEMQRKDDKQSTISLPQNVQKSVDYDFGRHCQESRKPNSPDVVTGLLKEHKESKEHITQPMTTNVEFTQRSGDMINSEKKIKDTKQFTSDNSKPQNEQDIATNPKTLISKVVPTCKDSQDTQSTNSSKPNKRHDRVELKENTQVGQKVCAIDFKREKRQNVKEKDNVLNKNAETSPLKSEDDNKKNSPLVGISYTNISNSTTAIGSHAHENTPQHNSKISATVTENSKIKETIDKEVPQAHSFNWTPKQDKGEYLCKCKPDISPVQNNQEAISETPNAIIPEIVSKDPAVVKESKASQNTKEFVWKYAFSEQEKDKFKKSDETKDRREIGITAFRNQQIVKGNCSIGEDLHKKDGINMNQCLLKSPNITLEDKTLNENELGVNKDIVTVQNNLIGKQENNKRDSIKAKGFVLSNIDFQKVTGEKALSVMGSNEDSKRLDIQKWKGELAQVQKENVKDEITLERKDNSKKAFNWFKAEKDTEGESNKDGNNINKPRYKKDKDAIDKIRKDDGETKSMFGATVVKDSSDSIRKEIASSGEVLRVKLNDRTHVYQYHPGKGFLPETKENVYDEQNSVGASHYDEMLIQTECTSTLLLKSEVAQRDKKTRPEISALADYARLRVISAEDDSTNEKDLLQKMDPCHKYNLTSKEPQKGNMPMSEGGTEPKTELTLNKNHENQGLTIKPLQAPKRDQPLFQRNKFTKEELEGHNHCTSRDETIVHPKLSSLAKRSDDQVFAVKETGITRENLIQSTTKTYLTEQHYGYRKSHENLQCHNPQVQHILLSQDEGKNNDPAMLRQPVHAKLLEKDIYRHVKNQESLPQMSNGSICNKVNKQADIHNKVQPEMNQAEKVEELEYYTVSNMESEPKPEEIHETQPFSKKIASKTWVTEIPTTRPRSNSSSPAMGKPTMFKVKDNTIRMSSVSKAVKPRFHRSFSEELRIGSPKETWSNSERSELEHVHEPNPKVSVNPPVLHETTVSSHQLPRIREIQSHNNLPLAEFIPAKQQRSYLRRSQVFEDDETQSVFSTVSEDVDSVAEGSVVTSDSIASHVFGMKSNRDIFVRPESACYIRPESACYERPESACYERPESSCSDMRPLGKPPTVPPKTEKALRRAKKLMTRRNIKAEIKMMPDNQGQLETIRTAPNLSSSSKELMSTNHTVHDSPPISHYHVEPNYATPAPSLVGHAFPMTQRKLLQDPNSGQYFMVDLPVHIKAKTFFDPETGKYVQLNVRQRTQSTHPQPQSVDVLNHPYIVYPGFLPMSVSSLPTLRSSSQMSAPATLEEEQSKLEACNEPWKQETSQSNHKKNHQYNNPVHGTHEKFSGESFYTENNVDTTQRHTDIITMSELEDFAMEST